MPNAKRGEVWLVDLGMTAKVRPTAIFNTPFRDDERPLCHRAGHEGVARRKIGSGDQCPVAGERRV